MAENLRTQVKNLKPALLASRSGLPGNPSKWKGDGEDHINLMANGDTYLGRFLSIRYYRSFDHPMLGKFRSLNNLWFFIRAENPDDTIRDIQEHDRLRNYVASNGGERQQVKQFQAAFMHSAYLRLLTTPSAMVTMMESTLPFDCYRKTVATLISQRLFYSEWLASGYEEIRKALKERREPDFAFLMDNKKHSDQSKIYQDIIESITGHAVTAPLDISGWIADRWDKYDQHVASQDQAAARKTRANKKHGNKKPQEAAEVTTMTGVEIHAIDSPEHKQETGPCAPVPTASAEPAVVNTDVEAPVVADSDAEVACQNCNDCACQPAEVAQAEAAEALAVAAEENHEDVLASKEEVIEA